MVVMLQRSSFRLRRRRQAHVWEGSTSTLSGMAFMPDKRASRCCGKAGRGRTSCERASGRLEKV